jgi:CubicO group peptidase (beta-lactamase class C family)
MRLFCLLLTSAALYAQPDAARIDPIFEPWNKPTTPGAAVAVIRDGKIAFQKGYGIANLEYDTPITPDTVFHVASVSKQFTAMCIVLLERDGKLSIEDDIRKYLPELPDYGRKITIRNLLQHTSGIRDQWQTLAIAGWRLDDVITQKQILRMLFRQKELNFDPGTRHLYSNSGFTLLAEIVARVSGVPFPQFADERIFKPLRMTRTHFHDDHRRIVRDRAYSYEAAGAGYQASPLNYANAGATSLFTTAPDLTKWLDNFRDPKVGGPAAVARLQEEAVLTDGTKIEYALGISTGNFRGMRTLSHGGSDAGYRSFVTWFPDRKLGVAVVSNLASFNSGGIANRVAAAALELEPEPAAPARTARTYITLEPAAIDRFTGYYQVDMLIQVARRNDKLVAGPPGMGQAEFKAVAPNRFFSESMDAELEFEGAAVKVTRPGGTLRGRRVEHGEFDAKDLPSYPGIYWSEELETQYSIVLKDGKLIADHARHGEIALTPTSKDHFRTTSFFVPEASFLRDSSGKVIAMTVGGGRISAIRFQRK